MRRAGRFQPHVILQDSPCCPFQSSTSAQMQMSRSLSSLLTAFDLHASALCRMRIAFCILHRILQAYYQERWPDRLPHQFCTVDSACGRFCTPHPQSASSQNKFAPYAVARPTECCSGFHNRQWPCNFWMVSCQTCSMRCCRQLVASSSASA